MRLLGFLTFSRDFYLAPQIRLKKNYVFLRLLYVIVPLLGSKRDRYGFETCGYRGSRLRVAKDRVYSPKYGTFSTIVPALPF